MAEDNVIYAIQEGLRGCLPDKLEFVIGRDAAVEKLKEIREENIDQGLRTTFEITGSADTGFYESNRRHDLWYAMWVPVEVDETPDGKLVEHDNGFIAETVEEMADMLNGDW